MTELEGVTLVVVRTWAVLRAQTGWRVATGGAWPFFALVAAAAWGPALGDPSGRVASEGVGWGWLALAELAWGTAVGGIVSLGGHAVLGAARWQASALGFPHGAWQTLHAAGAAALALALGLHRVALESLQTLARTWPVGEPTQWVAGSLDLGAGIALLEAFLALALSLATPVLLVGMVVELASPVLMGQGPIARSSTAALTLGLRLLGGWVALGAAWSTQSEAWAKTIALGVGALSGS